MLPKNKKEKKIKILQIELTRIRIVVLAKGKKATDEKKGDRVSSSFKVSFLGFGGTIRKRQGYLVESEAAVTIQ